MEKYAKFIMRGRAKIEKVQKGLISLLNGAKSNNKAQEIKSMHIVNAIAAKVTTDVIASLANRSEVMTIEPDEIVLDLLPNMLEFGYQILSRPITPDGYPFVL